MRACSAIVRVRSALRPFRRLSARRWPYMATTWAKLGSVWSVGCESACVTRPARAGGGGRNRPIRRPPRGRSVPAAPRPARPTAHVHAGCRHVSQSASESSEFRRGPPALAPHPNVSREEGTAPLALAPLTSPRPRGAGGRGRRSANRSCAGDRELGLECGRARSVPAP